MYDTVIFDMDGTLLDTLDDMMDSVNDILEKYGYPIRTREEIKTFVGNGVYELIKAALPDSVDQSDFTKAVLEFKEYYNNHCMVKTRPYDGIMGMMKALKDKKIKMAIVSNKSDAAVKELARHYFNDYIDTAIGEQEGVGKKPTPDMVNEAMRILESNKVNTIYVGDSEVDKATADNSGIDCVLVDWGFRDRSYLEELNVRSIISNPMELMKYIL